MKKWDVFKLYVVTRDNNQYICKQSLFKKGCYKEVLTEQKYEAHEIDYIEPLTNYHALSEVIDYGTKESVKLDHDGILKEYRRLKTIKKDGILVEDKQFELEYKLDVVKKDIVENRNSNKSQENTLQIMKKMIIVQPILLAGVVAVGFIINPSSPSTVFSTILPGAGLALGFTGIYYGITYPIIKSQKRKCERKLSQLEELETKYSKEIAKANQINLVKTDAEVMSEIQKKTKQELERLAVESPEEAKRMAVEDLKSTGILDETGELKAPYNGEIGHNDFTMGPKLTRRKKQ